MPPIVPNFTGPPSPELEEELDRQASQLLARVLEGRERVERLRALAVAAESQLDGDEAMLRHVHALLGRPDQLCLDTLDSHLRGARVREVAVQILEQRNVENEGSTTATGTSGCEAPATPSRAATPSRPSSLRSAARRASSASAELARAATESIDSCG